MQASRYPILMLVLDSQQARWFSLKRNGIDELHHIRHRRERYSDDEGFYKMGFPHSHAIKGGAPDIKNSREQENLHQHFKEVLACTKLFWKNNQYNQLIFVLPHMYMGRWQKTIRHELPNTLVQFMDGLYTHYTAPQLDELVRKQICAPELTKHSREGR